MDPLKYIFQKSMPTGRLAKWQILLNEFDIIYVTCTTMKAQALEDNLAENSVDDEYQPLSTYFPDEEVNSVEVIPEDTNAWKMFFNGVVNAKGVRIGEILISPTSQHYPATVRLQFICTNNITEYEACIMGMNMAIDRDVEKLLIMGDSDLLSGKLRYRDIKRLLKTKEYPEQVSGDQKRTIRRIASSFFLIGEDLYKRTPDLNLLRFILVAIDYFTKWVEAVTFKAITKKAVVDFVHSNIICRFGIPKTIITDNAANLNSHLMREVCEQFKIMHRHFTPYWPKANGVIEAANKNIKKILKKIIQSSRQWYKKLPFALLGYRITVRTSIRATPYLLVYGTQAVILAEVKIPSLRIIVEAEIEDDELVKTWLEQLTIIDENRAAVVCHEYLYQQRMARAYNKNMRPRNFEVGQLVLRHFLPHHEEAKRKICSKLESSVHYKKTFVERSIVFGRYRRK
ncbi:uncharacterized protein [Nicotiana sylvestris]|uniref:uncharacterized protein n=1 Tax=Nicotiana sylvestris TaxID=4096 RepID=UPI00388CE72D